MVTGSDDLLRRHMVRDSVRDCVRCPLHLGCNGPVPFSGVSPSRIAIVGEAPGRVEDEEGKPFVGPSGQLARTWVDGAGLGDVAWVNVVSCFPNRTPTEAEVNACRENLTSQLTVIQPSLLLLFGGIAASAFVPGLRIGEVRGQWWKATASSWGETWGMATWHPAAELRNRELERDVMLDLVTFRDVAVDLVPPWVSRWCVKCSHEAHVWSPEGIPWCQKHWDWKYGTAGKGRVTKPRRNREKVKMKKGMEPLL